MRCLRCNGLIIHDTGDSRNRPRDYCYSCGREPKKAGEMTSGGLRDASPLGSMPERIMPDQKGDPALNGEEAMSYHLKPEKEEEVKTLLKDYSTREIVAKTGVAKATIARIRNENFTAEQKIEMKERLNVKNWHSGLQKDKENIPKIIPSPRIDTKIKTLENLPKECSKCKKEKPRSEFTINNAMPDGLDNHCRECKTAGQRTRRAAKLIRSREPEIKVVVAIPERIEIEPEVVQEVEIIKNLNPGITKFVNFRIPEGFDFVDITRKYVEYLNKREDEIIGEVKKLVKELSDARTHRTCLEDFLCADQNDKKLSEDVAFREYIEIESEVIEEIPCEQTR